MYLCFFMNVCYVYYVFIYIYLIIIYLNLCIGRVVGGLIPLPNIWPELGM